MNGAIEGTDTLGEPGGSGGLEVLDVAGHYAADAAAMRIGVAGTVLMENAGRAVAEAAADLAPFQRGRMIVLAGPGNNGGDGFVAARHLARAGHDVRVFLLGDAARLKGDAAWAANAWNGEIAPLDDAVSKRREALAAADVVIDALFGAGLARPLEGAAAQLAEICTALRATGRPRVLAVDVPSGLQGDSGQPLGEACFAANVTVSFFRPKPAHLLLPGREICGRLVIADIGIPSSILEEVRAVARINAPALWRPALPRPDAETHKYRRGSLVVLSGDALHTGAARLAAVAGLRAGAGLVTLAGEQTALSTHACHVTEVMLEVAEDAAGFLDVLGNKRARAVVIGPAAGISPRLRETTLAVLHERPDVAVVLDADVFTVFAERPDDLFAATRDRPGAVVMTPHEGEFARLFADLATPAAKARGKIVRAVEAAVRAGCTVLLKGADTVIAGTDGEARIEAAGPPWLATAGSGDVLAGLIGGLLAQGTPPFAAASAAVWAHARAARRVGPALVAGEISAPAGRLLAELADETIAMR